jgi:hypothetical protein
MTAYGGVDAQIHTFFTSVIVGVEWSASRPCLFNPGKALPTRWTGDWVDPRTSLGDVEKKRFLTLSGLEIRSLYHLARSQTLYLLSYSGSDIYITCFSIKTTPHSAHRVYFCASNSSHGKQGLFV